MFGITSFRADSYRGISGLELKSIAPRANLITGANGVGKTALLEALWLFHGRGNPSLVWNINVHRGAKPPLDAVSALSPAGEAIELSGVEGGRESRVRLLFEHLPSVGSNGSNGNGGEWRTTDQQMLPFPLIGRLRQWLDGEELLPDRQSPPYTQTDQGVVVLPPPTLDATRGAGVLVLDDPRLAEGHVQRYSEVVNAGQKHHLLDVLRTVRPSVADIEMLLDTESKPYIMATMDEGSRRSLRELGGGMTKLFRFVVEGFGARNGILLLDELENGLHYRKLESIWGHLKAMCERLNVQIIATTHSGECIEAAISAFADEPDELAVHALFHDEDDVLRSTCLTGEGLEGAVSLGLEMR